MKYWGIGEWLTFVFLPMIGFALISIVVYAAIADTTNNHRLMQQCMADGYKEYECAPLLRGRSRAVRMPMLMMQGGR